MPSLKVVMPQDESDRASASRGRRSFGCWRRCCSLRPSRSTRRSWRRGCRRGSTCARALAPPAGGLCDARRQPGAHRRQVDVPHRQRSLLAAQQGDGRDAQALARRDRDARHHRLSPAGDPHRDRGDPRRDDLQGLGRRAAGDRMDPSARAAQGARPSGDLRHQRGVPVAFRARRGRRSAGARGAQGLRHCSTGGCRPASRCRCRRTIRRCARTRIRWNRAISISGWRRRPSASARE